MTEISDEQTQALVDFWQARPHLAIVGSSTALTPKVVPVWRELTQILNNCQGEKKSWKDWALLWMKWRKKIKRKQESTSLRLTYLDTILATFMFELDGDHEKACSEIPYRIRRRKAVKDLNAIKETKKLKAGSTKKKKDVAVSCGIVKNKTDKYADDDSFKGLENVHVRKKSAATTYVQKCMMLDFWERNMLNTAIGESLSFDKYIKLWEELTKMLNSDDTDGPKKSRKEWCKSWSDVKCKGKRLLSNKEPETSFEKRLARYLCKYDGEDWCRNKKSEKLEDNVLKIDPNWATNKYMSTKQEISLMAMQKERMLEFWKENSDYVITRLGFGDRFRKQRRRLWDKLAGILNKYKTPQRSRQHWVKIWNEAIVRMRSRHSKQIKLTDFEAQLAELLAKCQADTYSCRIRLAKELKNLQIVHEKKNMKVLFARLDKDYAVGPLYDNQRERRKGRRNKGHAPLSRHDMKITSQEQKVNLLEFWKQHHLISGGVKVKKKSESQKLWKEVTEILHECDGPKRTWKEWSQAWSVWKLFLRRKMFNQKEITGDLDQQLAEYITETEHYPEQQSTTQLCHSTKPKTQSKKESQNGSNKRKDTNEDPLFERKYSTLSNTNIVTDANTGINIRAEQKVEFEEKPLNRQTYNVGGDLVNPMRADFDLRQQSFSIHQENLCVQEKVLLEREELVKVVKDGIQLVVDIIQDRIKDNNSMTQLEKKYSNTKINRLEKSTESEFDLFAKYVLMQLQMLPREIASETKELILQVFREIQDRGQCEITSEPEEAYIIQVMDDNWESDLPWVEKEGDHC